jgi:hypothetical protein
MLRHFIRSALSLSCLTQLCLAHELAANPQASTRKPVETTITQLVESGGKFNGKLVRVFASFHSGRHVTVLLEPNCGLLDGTSKAAPPGDPQCDKGIIPVESDKAESDPGNADLYRALEQNPLLGTMDKHITAEFTGKFRCVPSCAHPKSFELKFDRVENLKVEMKDLNPHRPTD